jgi:hypothetical protein
VGQQPSGMNAATRKAEPPRDGQSRSRPAEEVPAVIKGTGADSVSTRGSAENPEMNRGEMIRRLDAHPEKY